MKLLACLGHVAEITILTLGHEETEEAMHATLWEAVYAGLIERPDGAYRFLHDRIQQAAYSLIPHEHRADIHLRIGRALLANMTPDQLADHLFDVANQLNQSAARLIERDEKTQVAAIDLRAGRKAKGSAAFASARAYFSAGMALLDENDWISQHELTFSPWLERAECEYQTGHFDEAEQLIAELLQRGASKADEAAVCHLRVQLYVIKSDQQQAVAVALTCLRRFGINMPAHPTQEQVQAEYASVWQSLDGRSIESLIDLPLMTDPELNTAMLILSVLLAPAYFTDHRLWCLQNCHMVKLSVQHGTSKDSALAYAAWGTLLAGVFHRYDEGYRFAKLACDLVEKHGFIVSQASVYVATGMVAVWTQSIGTAIDFWRKGFRAAYETGGPTWACYCMFQTVSYRLLRNDPLDEVEPEADTALDFVRKAKFGDATDIVVSQQRFIATMQGRTATFSTFDDAHFDEATFEAQLTGNRMPLVICWYSILKLKARFLSGDYQEALDAANKVKVLLPAAAGQFMLLDYFYYAALTLAALYENATTDEQNSWRELLTTHQEQLREWAENCPPTFADKYALVSAEIARLEGRDADAMSLYEQAIQSARENGFVQNEGTAHEVAARFYAVHGAESIAHSCLRNARSCYLRWGAHGKVWQLDRLYPHLAVAEGHSPTATVGSIQQLDVASIVKASQALSTEIELPKLIERLMTIALENAGADRGLLVLPAGEDYLIRAHGQTTGDRVEVVLRQTPISRLTCPDSLLHYVIRTRESVIIGMPPGPICFRRTNICAADNRSRSYASR
jgi:tetratricopeptide (TPR) repeat protein